MNTPPEMSTAAEDNAAPELIRLQRVLAQAGLGSRRACEELITAGRVTVDNQVVSTLGSKVDPERQSIRVDGEPLRLQQRVYFMLNKPVGILSTNRDEAGRPRTIDLIPTTERIYSVGRLDKSSEGLILLTNDGDLAQRLTHPRHGVTKTYLVRVAGQPTQEQLNQLLSGVRLAEGIARVAAVRLKKAHKNYSELEMVLDEGRNREIRRVLAAIGHKVVNLKRIAIGPLRLGDLPSGASRRLERREVAALRAAGGSSGTSPPPRRPRNSAPTRVRTKPRNGPPRQASTARPSSRPSSRSGQRSAPRTPQRPAPRGGGKRSGPRSRPPRHRGK